MALMVTVGFDLPRSRTAPLGRAAYRSIIKRAARSVLRNEGIGDAEVNVTILDDQAITEMNREYLGHDYPTDVISFPLHAEGDAPLGDIYIGWDQALRQAGEVGEEFAIEVARLTIHGTLHLLGYDHPEDQGRESSKMWKLQEEILKKVIGI